jgi:hypothetical protein
MQAASPLSVQSSNPPPPMLRPSARVLLWLTLSAAAAHWLLLGGWLLGASGKPPAAPSPRVTLIQLRPVTAPAVAADAKPVAAEKPVAPIPPAPAAPPRALKPAATPESAAAEEPAAAPNPAPQDAAEGPSAAASEAQLVSASAEAASQPASATTPSAQALPGLESDVPVYRVALPPGFSTSYEFRRGALGGTAEITWTPAGGRYVLRLQAKIGEMTVLTQTSEGRFESTGLEPERFVDKRLNGTSRAVNFQSDKGIITFSGPTHSYAWRLGTQDRLSWLIQLPSILAAESQRLAEGQRFAMVVVGARGEADVWTFKLVGWDTVATSGGEVRCVKLLREARHPHDQQVEVWLDTQRHYLPVRARIGGPEDAKPFELLRK